MDAPTGSPAPAAKAPANNSMKVAIVHDWLYGGGAERVVYELHQMFPDAPIYTSYCSDEWRKKLDNKVVTGYLQKWPFNRLRKILPVLRIGWFERLDLSEYDLVISSSGNGEAKSVKAGSKFRDRQTHICYCHTPTHFYWRHYDTYIKEPGFGVFNPIVRLALRLLVEPLRKWDLKAAQRPDYFIANSSHIRDDIKQYYGRDAKVIYPPVDVARFAAADSRADTGDGSSDGADPGIAGKRQGFLTVGRQVPQKHTDIIVQACTELNLPLTVIGRGPMHDRLVQMAGPSVTFLTGSQATDDVIVQAMASAEAFIFAAFDDFGIVPIEAMAAGTPVIAYRAGGALDYMIEGVNGEFFDEQTASSLTQTLQNFNADKYDHDYIRNQAQRFSDRMFRMAFEAYLEDLTTKGSHKED